MSHPRQTLDALGAAARKSLSQNFLVSPHWAKNLAKRVATADCEAIWEIGPGLGALTRPLLEGATVPVTLFEYDRKLAAYLRETLPGIELCEGDVLDQDLAAIANNRRIAVLSNLPYHLSSAILFALAELPTPPVRMVLTFQKEFARRVVAVPSTPAYGALSVSMQLQFQIESLGIIPPGAFYPVPDVDSEALEFAPHPGHPALPSAFRALIRAAFQQRRKRLASNLKRALAGHRSDSILEEMGVGPNARPEELSPQQYLELGERLGLLIAQRPASG